MALRRDSYGCGTYSSELESETLHLPELRPLIGKTVEIVIQEENTPAITPVTGDWDAAMKAVRELEEYDFDAYQKQREYDLRHAKDHLP
ncbi:MAG: hypothetical protein ACJ8FY_08415 [Gemmataceae bacterium]